MGLQWLHLVLGLRLTLVHVALLNLVIILLLLNRCLQFPPFPAESQHGPTLNYVQDYVAIRLKMTLC